MKVTPDLFTTTPVGTRSNSTRATGEASQARLAFEAMLTAASMRQKLNSQTTAQVAGNSPAPPTTTAEPLTTAQTPANAPLARPGRVLDIRV